MEPEFQVEGAVDIGPDKVLAVISNHFSGKSSGVSMDQRIWLVITLSAGKVTRTEAYGDPTEALEAAGLSELAALARLSGPFPAHSATDRRAPAVARA